jgi:hypothetical protein
LKRCFGYSVAATIMLLPLLLFFRFSRQGVCILHAASIAAMVDPNPSAIHAIVSNMFMAHVTQGCYITSADRASRRGNAGMEGAELSCSNQQGLSICSKGV